MDVQPNSNHRVLARHLIETRGWGITPNFDDAVERAAQWRIPVHVVDPDSGSLKVLYGDQDANWGLIKIHGTVGLGVHGLCATLSQLTPGLPAPMRELLERVLSAADILLVAITST